MGTIHHPRFLIAVVLAGIFLALSLLSLPVLAQSGCTGDPCVFQTPTPTATGTPRPTPGPGTPTPVPMAPTVVFGLPDYSQPTSIPAMTFPPVPTALSVSLPNAPAAINPDPLTSTFSLDVPDAISISVSSLTPISFTSATAIPLSGISTTFSISYTTPATLGAGSGVTGTEGYSDVSGSLVGITGLVSDVVSYTTWLSTTVDNINPTETFTIASAPDWYAPPLPRPLADVGWTFETLQSGIDTGRRYTVASWAGFFGYVVSLPFQFMKVLYQIVQFLGPLGLFLTWLLLMAPLVTYFRILLFFKNLFISLLNFIIKVIGFLLDLGMSLVKLVVGFFV